MMSSARRYPAFIALSIAFLLVVTVMHASGQAEEKCGTMQLLHNRFLKEPALQERFRKRELQLQQKVQQRLSGARLQSTPAVQVTVPVVFHIVLPDPDVVTDLQLQAQMDTLNKDYAGTNGDSIRIPFYFKPLFGKTGIRFSFARRTPSGDVTNGIDRVVTAAKSYAFNDNNMKYTASGGADAWNTDHYLNIWITNLSNGILGYATFPADSIPDQQGVVIQYTSLPGGPAVNFNQGKTLTHEVGHFFDLYHIWGDDNGACTGTDFVNDTPNQSNSTTGCPDSVKLDNCTPAGSGIMYQNYMDYSGDACLVMFTNQQAVRMETALTNYRASLLTSLGAVPLVRFNRDAELRLINNPSERVCTQRIAPLVTIRNVGIQPLSKLTVNATIDNGPLSTVPVTGTIASLGTASVTLNGFNVTPGAHVLTVFTSGPNDNTDEYTANDTMRITFIYTPPLPPPVTESFEGSGFPPPGWDIVNPDRSNTWQSVTGIAKTGNASVMINNFNNYRTGQQDYLRMPQVAIAGADSAFLTFQVAAAAYTALNTAGNNWDTLEVLLSTDCGNTYTSLYKKWGASLVTRQSATVQAFVPAAGEWRKDSVNITPYIGNNNVLLAFRNTNENENNIYLDDIRLYTISINPNLRARGYLVTPNPASNAVTIQFYPQPADLQGLTIYSASGQQMTAVNVAKGQAVNAYTVDISRYAPGIYFFRAVFSNRVITHRFIKY